MRELGDDRFELLATVLHLVSANGEPLAPDAGRLLHAAFLRLVATQSLSLAQRLHTPAASKPFTLALMTDSLDKTPLLRVTSLDADLTSTLQAVAASPIRPLLSLGAVHFSVEPVEGGHLQEVWTGCSSWDRLVKYASSHRAVTFVFASPTTFSFGKRKVPLPLPELIFGSLLKKWNTFSPVELPRGLLALFREQLAVSEIHNLSTEMLDFGRYKEKGFIGRVTFEALETWSEGELRDLNTLANFAFYAGVGYKTTMGMGLTRRILNPTKGEGEHGPV